MHRARQKIIFLSTPSARRATPAQNSLRVQKAGFLSTPSARRATLPHSCGFFVSIYFYPRPPRGGRPSSIFDTFLSILFLSTPSARRATLPVLLRSSYDIRISIHALREEGDVSNIEDAKMLIDISIHALREEGDQPPITKQRVVKYFYPRPPRGGRRILWDNFKYFMGISIPALREEGDGLPSHTFSVSFRFLSTPSARRATCNHPMIFVDVLRFLSTPSARRATG